MRLFKRENKLGLACRKRQDFARLAISVFGLQQNAANGIANYSLTPQHSVGVFRCGLSGLTCKTID
jgi:hypothetical protein